MKKTIWLLLFLAALPVKLANSQSSAVPADLVLKNGIVYTVNDQQPTAEAVAIKGPLIVYVGSNRDVKKYEGPGTKVVDLKGAAVFPGFTDAHYHLSGVGQREMTLNLEGLTSLEAFLAKVKERVSQTTPGEWVTGRGWIETFWTPPVFPTRGDLDRIAPDHPVYLVRADGHGAVANSRALQLAGIDKGTPNPDGGEIMKDRATGEPNGMLLDRAMGRVTMRIPQATRAQMEQAILLGAQRSVQLGWTQIQNAGGGYQDVEMMRKLYDEGRIALRIYQAVSGPGPASAKLIKEGPVLQAHDGRFTLRTIKVHFDGALGSKGAALLEPYADHPTSGFLTQKEDDVQAMLLDALKAGIQVETHAIGDRANRVILDLYEKAMATVPPAQRKIADPRWRVEHAQIIHPTDLPRFAKLGVIPSMQPSHAIGDLHFAVSRLGLERLKGAYAWNSLLKSGVIIAGGSDAPVERGEPLIEFYAAVARKDLKGFSGQGWHPEERVSREQALKMFTIWAAYAAFEENHRGSIQSGKWADLTVFSSDIMKIPEPEILKTYCRMTVINGEIAFQTEN